MRRSNVTVAPGFNSARAVGVDAAEIGFDGRFRQFAFLRRIIDVKPANDVIMNRRILFVFSVAFCFFVLPR